MLGNRSDAVLGDPQLNLYAVRSWTLTFSLAGVAECFYCEFDQSSVVYGVAVASDCVGRKASRSRRTPHISPRLLTLTCIVTRSHFRILAVRNRRAINVVDDVYNNTLSYAII